jgi:hypothetical protein
MGVRPYDPAIGRFYAVDPIEGGALNNYDFAGQDPINNQDLDGTVCGPGSIPGGDAAVPDLIWKDACQQHDDCYGGKGKFFKWTRKQCDYDFELNAMVACYERFGYNSLDNDNSHNKPLHACYGVAKVYYEAIRVGGQYYSGYYDGHFAECRRRKYSVEYCKKTAKYGASH